jgi:membrane protease YdiL (CAAX protease family)
MGAMAAPPGPPNGARPSLRRAPEQREMAVVAGLAFFLNLFPGTFLQLLNFRWGLLLTQTFFVAGPVMVALHWFYLDRRAIIPLRRPRATVLAATVLATAGLNILLTIGGAWQERVAPTPERLRAFFEALFQYRGPLDFALLLLLFGCVPAICEEVLFRGFLQAGFVQAFESAPKGIALTALTFAVFHVDPWRFPGILILGLFLGFLAHRTGSLIPPILAHALNNVLSISLSVRCGPCMDALQGSVWSVPATLLLIVGAGLLLRRAAA